MHSHKYKPQKVFLPVFLLVLSFGFQTSGSGYVSSANYIGKSKAFPKNSNMVQTKNQIRYVTKQTSDLLSLRTTHSKGRSSGPVIGNIDTSGTDSKAFLHSRHSVENLVLELKPRNTALLYRYASQVDQKGSPYYHRYLGPQQIKKAFSPNIKSIVETEKILRSRGFQIGKVPSDKLLISFSGPVSEVASYFKSVGSKSGNYATTSFIGDMRVPKGSLALSVTEEIQKVQLELPKQLQPYAMAVISASTPGIRGQFTHPTLLANTTKLGQSDLIAGTSQSAGGKAANQKLHTLVFGSKSIVKASVMPDKTTAGEPLKVVKQHAVILSQPPSLENPVFTDPAAPHACPAALQDAQNTHAWTESAIANSYGLGGLYNQGDLGQGETIAVFELEPFSNADLATFEKCYFGRSFLGNVTKIPLAGFSLKGSGSGEAILDMEVLSALAPKAHLLVYEAPNTAAGVLEAYNDIVTEDRANIVTTSWGECETTLQASAPGVEQLENFMFEEAAIEGITVFAATGDDGADDCASTPYGTNEKVAPYLSVDDPSSQPFVVAVGGTTLLQATNPPLQSVWNDGPSAGGGGGGISSVWQSPVWQNSAQVPGIIQDTYRQLPDISATANEYYGITTYSSNAYGFSNVRADQLLHPNKRPIVHRMSLKNTGAVRFHKRISKNTLLPKNSQNTLLGGWTTVGGTSEAAPVAAASMALVASSAACSGLPSKQGGPDLGFVSPLLYELASDPTSYSQSFNQVTSGNNDIFHDGKGYNAAPGYNPVTGLGSMLLTNSDGSPALDTDLCRLAVSQATATDKTGLPQSPNSAIPTTTGGSISISGITPNAGSVRGGEEVTISGNGFSGSSSGLSVYFGDVKAKIISSGENQITVITPPSPIYHSSAPFDGAGEVTVTVANTVGQGLSATVPSVTSVFNYLDLPRGLKGGPIDLPIATTGLSGSKIAALARPVITAIGPSGGKEKGRTRVTIFGNGFTQAGGIKTVLFGDRKAVSYRVISDHEVIAVSPAMNGATKCKTGKGFEPSSVCQVDVQIIARGGKSPLSRILPPVVGEITVAPGGYDEHVKGRETTPASTEFDYANPPVIKVAGTQDQTGVSNIPITMTGKNFNILTLEWANIGNPKVAANEQTKFVYITNNSLVVITSVLPNSVVSSPGSKEISLQSVVGMSNAAGLSQVSGN